MKTLWGRQSWLDYINWQHVERETAAKINDLVADDLKEIASDATRVAILFNPAKCWQCTRCQGDRNCGTDDA